MMAIIIALDNYDVAVEIARRFYQTGVLTVILSDKNLKKTVALMPNTCIGAIMWSQ